MSRGRLIFMIFALTCVLLGTVHLRISSSRLFYRYRKEFVKHKRLKRTLWHKQLEVERALSPVMVWFENEDNSNETN
jgi:hypothetical protein